MQERVAKTHIGAGGRVGVRATASPGSSITPPVLFLLFSSAENKKKKQEEKEDNVEKKGFGGLGSSSEEKSDAVFSCTSGEGVYSDRALTGRLR